MRKLVIVLLSFLSLVSCNKENAWDCVKTTGDEVTIIRDLGSYSSIDIKDDFEITIVQDSVNFVKLTGGKNVLPKIITEVNEGVLFIENTNKCVPVRSFKREIQLEIHVFDLKLIHNEGVGDINSLGILNFPKLTLEVVNGIGNINLELSTENFETYIHSGAIDLTVSGLSDEVYIYNAGLGYMFCKNLITSTMHLNHNSTGDAEVFSNYSLIIENDGIGNVYYFGNPTLVSSSNGLKNNVFKK